MDFPEKLIMLRRKNGLSQEQLAEMLGVTRQSVSKWESAGAIPELAKIIMLSEIFHVTIDYLVKEGENDIELYFSQEKTDTCRLEEKMDMLTEYFRGYHYTSKTKIAGIPLVSIRLSRRMTKDCVAKGIIAIGNVAIGVISIGCFSLGVISMGAFTVGLIAVGAIAVGAFAIGAVAVGVLAVGATAIGFYSIGAAAFAKEIAVGASASAVKTAIGKNVTSNQELVINSQTTVQTIKNFIIEHHPRLWKPVLKLFTMIGESIR